MTIKLLTFDLDDTLWPCMITIMRTEERLHQWFIKHHPGISSQYSIKQLRKKRQQLAKTHQHIAHDLTALRKKSFLELAIEMNYSPEKEQQFIQDAFELYVLERNKVSLYDDVIPTLEILNRDYLLGAVTNGNADIYKIGLGHLFEFSWSAADAGQQKPHPVVFDSLMNKYNLQANEIIHIGDDPISDIKGAQQSGIRAIWLNRNNLPWPKELNSPFIEINQLNQLPAIIKRL
ncbi:MAG: HAD family hydrolase [gamma proteobacterium symbiont of Bathyaustriella thionipta]|nr:HAD family hydrolase [gamma proteobacterium symbiont of Bathyaustriella thionipta]MCU7950944.1 HAD family hydrolase [gamma proteobacterium symbiont of Bathyaustriella thionipta]MCU7954532.1 HAD family hydrolase [gamma proteobacterium symbiont of Bathyaustriella thionipta]MCU7957433.1 HAD family hydrolase [gamma proteobacterium symbiont of Bathyaustriella thionipta]MCU7966000.1 HAD family hydrolase [gamma proteobacterium symbiont of Bathyaustriella thionipta]